jgi:hypothetical protein
MANAPRQGMPRPPSLLLPLVVSVLLCGTALAIWGMLARSMGWGGSEYTRREDMPAAHKALIDGAFCGYHGVLLGLVVGAGIGLLRRWLYVRKGE